MEVWLIPEGTPSEPGTLKGSGPGLCWMRTSENPIQAKFAECPFYELE